jgi:hypothetical protein
MHQIWVCLLEASLEKGGYARKPECPDMKSAFELARPGKDYGLSAEV